MTAQAYNALDGDSLGADKIIRATTMQSLYDNPTAIAQRGSGAPWNNGIGAMTTITSGSGNWTVPDGVYRFKVTAVGAGGAGRVSGSNGGSGGNTTFSTLTANGGAGGAGAGGAGGTGSGGDLNIQGQNGGDGSDPFGGAGGSSTHGFGGPTTLSSSFGGVGEPSGFGSGSSGTYQPGVANGGGGAGGTAIKIFTSTPGTLFAYAIGTGGAAAGASVNDGKGGIIIIEY